MARPSLGLRKLRDGARRTIRAGSGVVLLAASVLAAAVVDVVAPAALAARLGSLSGAGARDCGVFPLRSNLAAAIACAQDATSAGQSYRLAVQLQGSDSGIWQGAARDERGRLWVVFYDADSSGSATPSPTISVVPCRDILFALHGGEVLDCQPYSGTP